MEIKLTGGPLPASGGDVIERVIRVRLTYNDGTVQERNIHMYPDETPQDAITRSINGTPPPR